MLTVNGFGRRASEAQLPSPLDHLVKSAAAAIRDRITRQGKLAFADFMELALYNPEGGYYASSAAFGVGGDYFTGPAAHPAFGALLAIQFQRMWELLGRPEKFPVVEMGAGSGIQVCDVLEYAAGMDGDFTQSLRYIPIEMHPVTAPSPTIFNRAHPIIASGIPLREVVGCFISNELVDSFPVHRFQVDHGMLKEVYVTLDEQNRFTEVLDVPSTPLLAERLNHLDLALPEGFRGEINLKVRPWVKEMSEALQRGFVVTIDYGYDAKELYSSKRAMGTLQTYYRHTQSDSPYQRVGRQDMTAHVDFSLIRSEGKGFGLRSLGLMSQASFLRELGFEYMLENVRTKSLGQAERNSNLMAMRELVKPGGLGGFQVLIQEKDTGVEDLSELLIGHPPASEMDAPLLRAEHMPLLEGRYPHLSWEADGLLSFNGQD